MRRGHQHGRGRAHFSGGGGRGGGAQGRGGAGGAPVGPRRRPRPPHTQIADYGWVADWRTAIPELEAELDKAGVKAGGSA